MTADQQPGRQASGLAQAMVKTPYLSSLGVVFDSFEPDEVTLRLPFREDLTNDGSHYHGGVVASLLDTAGAGAAWSAQDLEKGTTASTIAMSVQYVGAAKRSDLVGTARTVRRARELIFTEITATDTEGRTVAHAVRTYRIV
jgi:uncharacterized protein (TIGR00369 family)